jgi:uncharacterized protein YcbK (DUF882 family)
MTDSTDHHDCCGCGADAGGRDEAEPRSASRRRFLAGTAAGAAMLVPWSRAAAALETRSLAFSHNHTGERLKVVYYEGGEYLPDAVAEINHLLRDFRTGEVWEMDLELLDTLAELRAMTGSRAEFQVISGYRSPKTNEMLRNSSSGVAKRSLHMQGRAIDVRLSGYDTAKLRKAALSLSRGGVGYYARSDFIHVDTGRVRTW